MILVGSTNALRIVRVCFVVNCITVILSLSFLLVLDTIRSGCHVVDSISTFVAFWRLSLLRASLTRPTDRVTEHSKFKAPDEQISFIQKRIELYQKPSTVSMFSSALAELYLRVYAKTPFIIHQIAPNDALHSYQP